MESIWITGKRLLEINFLRFDLPRFHPQRIPSDDVQRNREAASKAERMKTSHTSEDRQNQGTIPMSTFATRPSSTSYTIPVELPQKYMVGQQRDSKYRNFNSTEFHNPQSFLVWKIRFKTQVTISSDFPSDAVLWIKDLEMCDYWDEPQPSRSVYGKDFPNLEMLDAKIASALNKIIQNSQFKKKVSLEEQKAQKEDRFLRGRQIAFMIYDYFRLTGAHDTVLDYADLCSVTLRDDNVKEFDTRCDGVLLLMTYFTR